MKRCIFFLFFFILCKNPDTQNIESNFTTPVATIGYYWSQLSQRNYKEALRCFDKFSESSYNEHDIFPVPDIDSLKVDSILSLKIKNKEAEIYYRVSFFSKKHSIKKSFISGDRLVLTKSGWKIKDVLIKK